MSTVLGDTGGGTLWLTQGGVHMKIKSGAITIISLVADCPVQVLKYIADVSLYYYLKIGAYGTLRVRKLQRVPSVLLVIGLRRSHKELVRMCRYLIQHPLPSPLVSDSEIQKEFSFVLGGRLGERLSSRIKLEERAVCVGPVTMSTQGFPVSRDL